jgi:hypothetical protein
VERAVSDLPSNGVSSEQASKVVREIEAMADALGKRLYRGVLKTVARVWNPAEIHDMDVMRVVLEQMQVAERELRRLDAALNRVEPGTLVPILRFLRLNSLDQIDNLEDLRGEGRAGN